MIVIDSEAPEAGAPEITPAMIEAGAMAFRSNETTDPSRPEIAETVCEIFTAMSRAACRGQK
jgi:hypothetical protein